MQQHVDISEFTEITPTAPITVNAHGGRAKCSPGRASEIPAQRFAEFQADRFPGFIPVAYLALRSEGSVKVLFRHRALGQLRRRIQGPPSRQVAAPALGHPDRVPASNAGCE